MIFTSDFFLHLQIKVSELKKDIAIDRDLRETIVKKNSRMTQLASRNQLFQLKKERNQF